MGWRGDEIANVYGHYFWFKKIFADNYASSTEDRAEWEENRGRKDIEKAVALFHMWDKAVSVERKDQGQILENKSGIGVEGNWGV